MREKKGNSYRGFPYYKHPSPDPGTNNGSPILGISSSGIFSNKWFMRSDGLVYIVIIWTVVAVILPLFGSEVSVMIRAVAPVISIIDVMARWI